ncbi:hypothetical protein H4R33_004279 [Dimargaris cristalligena]|nr:hypothetical protein H4R33_004279 [Dimargaris cristalligena]
MNFRLVLVAGNQPLVPSVPAEYLPNAGLPLGKSRVTLPGFETYTSVLGNTPVQPAHISTFEDCVQRSMAILLSRYYQQTLVAFGLLDSPVANDQEPHQTTGPVSYTLALWQVDPDLPVASLGLSDQVYPESDNIPVSVTDNQVTLEAPGNCTPIEVFLHCASPGTPTSRGPPTSDTHCISAFHRAERAHTDLLTLAGAKLLASCHWGGDGVAKLSLTSARSAYRATAIEEFANQFSTIFMAVWQTLLSSIPNQLPTLVRDIPWVSDREQKRLLGFSCMNKPVQVVDRPIHHLFRDCAQRYPDHLALAHGTEEWTYAQLDYATSELARGLIEKYGSQREMRIALLIPKSIAFIVALLAVFKSGAAYVPIDPDYPTDRIQFILDDSAAALAITVESALDRLSGQSRVPVLVVDPYVHLSAKNAEVSGFEPVSSSPHDLAYVVYTSGTTGQPKGVQVEHRSLTNIVTDPNLQDAHGPGNRVIQMMSVAFDGILYEIFHRLCAGSTVMIPTTDILADLSEATAGCFVPSFLARLDPTNLAKLKAIVTGGESLTPELQAQWAHRCTLANMYGPTETTIFSNMAIIRPDDDITIGQPIRNVFNLVVDDELRLVPVGVPGELLIGGIGLARGYQNLPNATRTKFIPNPYGPGRVYRTGDYARWLPNGTVEFLGRIDNQIKLRGYRIELEEVENTASRFPGLKHSVAAVVHDKLVLYSSPDDLDHTALLEFLVDNLPKQMVPELLVSVTEFQTSTSGKLDRKSLPSIDHLVRQSSNSATVIPNATDPLLDVNQDLRLAWAQVLQLDPERINPTDHFFRIGGDSISAILLVSRVQKLGYQLTVPLIYQYPELHQMTQNIPQATTVTKKTNAIYSGPIQGTVDLTPVQRWFFSIPFHNQHHFNQSFTLKVNPHCPLPLSAVTSALVSLMNHHDILRARFQPGEDEQGWTQAITMATSSPVDIFLTEDSVAPVDYPDFILNVQSRLNLTTGPVLAAALIYHPTTPSDTRLFITIHHALVDLISWRILIEDLNTLLRGDPLPPKTLPFQAWAAQLGDYAGRLSADVWPTQVNPGNPIQDIITLLPPPEVDDGDTSSARISTSLEFNQEFTDALLFQLAPQWRVTPRDLLLATFTQTFAHTVGLQQVSLCMEGHGREPWSAQQDITRTVGWFTALYPLVLHTRPGQSLLEFLRHTKEALQQIPGKGFPYALLKYMPGVPAEERAKLQAKTPARLDVQFNYFGRFNNDANNSSSDDPLSIEWSDYFGLHDFAPDDHVIFDINPMPTIVGDCLRLVIEYNPRVYSRIVIDQVMAGWRHNLAELADVTKRAQPLYAEPLLTQFDFAHLQLSSSEFQDIVGELNRRHIPLSQLEELLPCIALQSGLLTGVSTNPSSYLLQAALKIMGPLDLDRLVRAWDSVAEQHAPLRTIFFESSAKQSRGFIQVVLQPSPNVWTIQDRPLFSLDEFFRSNRQRGFTLKDIMIRNFVFPTADDQVHHVVITIHHSLIDGWSLPLLLQAWMDAYHQSSMVSLVPGASFTDMVDHVQRFETTVAQTFWTEYLLNAPITPAPLLQPDYCGQSGFTTQATILKLPKGRLIQAAQKYGISLSVLLRAAYAVVLSRLLDQDDVVFGITVAGRNLEIPGIEQVIGPCANTVPFRVRLDRSPLESWLKSIHQAQIAMISFEHTQLTDITKWVASGRRRPLFHTLVGSEHFPDPVTNPLHTLVMSNMGIDELTEYQLAINFIERTTCVEAKVSYSRSTYSDGSIDQLVDMVQIVLGQIMAALPDCTVDQLSLDSPISTLPHELVTANGNEPLHTPTVSSLFQQWNDAVTKDPIGVVYQGDAHSLTYLELNQVANSLAFRTAEAVEDRLVSVVALVESIECLLGCLVAAITLGVKLSILPTSYSVDDMVAYIDSGAFQVVWLPSSLVESIRPYVAAESVLVSVVGSSGYHIENVIELSQHPSMTDPMDFGLSLISASESECCTLPTAHCHLVHHALHSMQSYFDGVDTCVVNPSLTPASPQFPWLALSCLLSGTPIVSSSLVAPGEETASVCQIVTVDDINADPCDGSRLVLCDLAQPTWADILHWLRPSDTCLVFIASIIHGHQVVTAEHLISRSLPSSGKPFSDTILAVLDGCGHSCPPGVVGRLALVNLHSADKVAPIGPPVLGYRSSNEMVHILGASHQRVIIDDRQLHLGVLEQVLVQAGARSPKTLLLPGGQVIVLVANASESEIVRLKERVVYPLVPAVLTPHFIISTRDFPHVSDILSSRLQFFVQAYLNAHLTHSTENLSETEWWLTVVTNELCSTQLSFDSLSPQAVHSTVGATLAQLEQLQFRIRQKYDVQLTIGDLVKHSDFCDLANIITNLVGRIKVTAVGVVSNHNSYPTVNKPAPYLRLLAPTERQQRIWSLSQLDEPQVDFHHHILISSSAPLRLEDIQRSINYIAAQYEELRCRFVSEQGVLTCRTVLNMQIGVSEHLIDGPHILDDAYLEETVPYFDVTQGTLTQVDLYQLAVLSYSETVSTISLRVHEISCDSYLFERIVQTFIQQLSSNSLNPSVDNITRPDITTHLPTKADVQYWTTLLRDPPTELGLSPDYAHPSLPTFQCCDVKVDIPEQLAVAIRNLSSSKSISDSDVWLTLFTVFLRRLTNQDDLVIDMCESGGHRSDTVISGDSSSMGRRPVRISGKLADTAGRLSHNFVLFAHSVIVLCEPWPTAPLISDSETRLLLKDFAIGSLGLTNPPETPHVNILELFFKTAKKNPEQVATEIGVHTQTYAALAQSVQLMANRLRLANVQPGDRVGVVATSHPDTIMCMLAIWCARAVYVPVDNKLPHNRQKYIVDIAECTRVVTVTGVSTVWSEALNSENLSPGPDGHPHESMEYTVQPNDTAYIVFTSGTTGLPKGIVVQHRSLNNVITNEAFASLRHPGMRFLCQVSPGFDASILVLLFPLVYGMTLVFPNETGPDILSTITSAMLPLSVIAPLEPSQFPNLKALVVGAEPLPLELAAKWTPFLELYNGYGPSETTIISHVGRVISGSRISIGRPIANTECYILDGNLQLVPIGTVGEIFIGGVCVSQGYINRPDLNASKFIDNPFTGQGKLYNSGDLGRWLPDGQVECLGRADGQIKLRGFRIELDEIRSVLLRQPGVKDCAVFVNDSFLVSYVIPETAVNEDRLRTALAKLLPSYMIPSYIVGLPTMPLTVNSKCDTKFLQNHFVEHLASQRTLISLSDAGPSPSSQPAKVLTQALIEVLGLSPNQVNLLLSFVKLGGDSISGIQVSSKCRQLGYALPGHALLGRESLQDAVQDMIAITSTAGIAGQLHAIDYQTSFPLTPIQTWFLDHPWANPHHFNQSFALELVRPISVAQLSSALLRLVNHHDMLRCQFIRDSTSSSHQWSQRVLPPFARLPVPVFELNASPSDLTDHFIDIQSSLDISQGHLLATGLITLSNNDTPQTITSQSANVQHLLFITVHHLVVDLVSWAIILEDLSLLLEDKPPVPQHLPFATWATELAEWAQETITTTNQDASPPTQPLETMFPHIRPDTMSLNYQDNIQARSIKLDIAMSNAVLHVDTHGIQPLEVMMAGLFRALFSISQAPTVTIFNESHGRLPFQPTLDPSRTVGWFTALVPCQAQVNSDTTVADYLKVAKQARRSSSGTQGLKYGLHHMLDKSRDTEIASSSYAPIEVAFNYLGNTTDQSTLTRGGRALWTVRPDLTSHLAVCDPAELRPQLLEVIGVPTSSGLKFTIHYCPQVVPSGVIESLLAEFQQALADMVHLLEQPDCLPFWTLSDFPLLSSTLPKGTAPEFDINKFIEEELPLLDLGADDIEDIYPCLPLQEGMLFATIQDPTAYAVQLTFTITGDLDITRFQKAWDDTAQIHNTLRTRFIMGTGGQADRNIQLITKSFSPQWVIGDWRDSVISTLDVKFTQAERAAGFPSHLPLIKFGLFRITENTYRFFVSAHHAILDGWSNGPLFRTALEYYSGLTPTSHSLLFKDFVGHILAKDQSEAESFWARQFASVETPSLLTEPHHRPDNRTHPNDDGFYGIVEHTVGPLDALNRFTKDLGITLSTVLRAALAAVLQRYTGSDFPVFGAVVSGRNVDLDGIANMVGLCINTVPCCVPLAGNVSVADVLQSIQTNSTVMCNYEHNHLSDIHRWSGISTEKPLFNTIFVLENYPETSDDPNLPIHFHLERGWDPTDYSLSIGAFTKNDQLKFRLTYRQLDFSDTFMSGFANHFAQAINSIVSLGPQASFRDVELFAEAERHQLLHSFAANPRPFVLDYIHSIFQYQARLTPNHTALIEGNERYTYAQLDTASDHFAQVLAQSVDCGPDRIIGILAERSLELVISQLAVWKTGSAFVCLVPNFPLDRMWFILADAQCPAVIGRAEFLAALSDIDISRIPIDALPLLTRGESAPFVSPAISPSNLAYVVYTSGSTGAPKGVMIEHQSLSNFMLGFNIDFPAGPDTVVPAMLTPTFDMSILEIWSPLSFGGTSLVFPGDYESALQLATRVIAVPSLMACFEPSHYPNLQQLILCGEPMPVKVAQNWGPVVELINAYGPSETTILSHWNRMRVDESTIHVGTPMANVTSIILDSYMRPVPIGSTGQIYLGGLGLARGYLQQPELTGEKFMECPFTGGRLYRSGDLGRWLPGGRVECLGRADFQVKLRGYRMELGEVESALERHPAVDQARVLIQDDTHLVGYVVPVAGRTAGILDFLRGRLPHYMVPSGLVELAQLPLTQVGKVDRRSLPRFDFTITRCNENPVELSPTETELVALIAEILEIEPSAVVLEATFFQLGGNSLTAIQLVTRCHRLTIGLDLADINRQNTIAYLAKLASVPTEDSAAESPSDIESDGYNSSIESA